MKAVAVATDAALITQCGGDGLAESNSAIFYGVMRVDGEIAIAAEFQIHRGMLGEERKHVVEERNAGADFGFSFAIQVEADRDLGFERVAFQFGGARFHSWIKPDRASKDNRATPSNQGVAGSFFRSSSICTCKASGVSETR